MNDVQMMQAAVDEIAIIDAQIVQLREKLRQLDELRDPLLLRIEKWNQNRLFQQFLRLPREIREMMYERYNSDTKYYHEGYLRNLAQICRQVREEYLDWLGWNRPLVMDRLLYYLFRRYIDRGQTEKVWPRMSAQIISRVQIVDVEAKPEAAADCGLYVASGEVRLIEPTETDDLIQEQGWRPAPGKSSVCFERLQLLGEFIAEEGVSLKKEHFELIMAASRIDTGPTDPQEWLRSELREGETVKVLEMLPFLRLNLRIAPLHITQRIDASGQRLLLVTRQAGAGLVVRDCIAPLRLGLHREGLAALQPDFVSQQCVKTPTTNTLQQDWRASKSA